MCALEIDRNIITTLCKANGLSIFLSPSSHINFCYSLLMIFWCASPFYRYLDGSHCFDEICSAVGYSNQALDDLLDKFPDVIICWK